MDLTTPSQTWAHSPDGPHPTRKWLSSFMMWLTVLVPYAVLVPAIYWLSGQTFGWFDITLMILGYLITGLGISVGYHRLLSHKSFEARFGARDALTLAGCMALQGAPVKWSAVHRRHHQKADRPGDPHSPHTHPEGIIGTLHGFWHAHTGWLLETELPDLGRSVKDLLADPVVQRWDRMYAELALLQALALFGLGVLVKGSIMGGLETVFWVMLVRVAVVHQITWSVNSVCHVVGYRHYHTTDESKNNPVVALFSFGEGWHNNHHAFPNSAALGHHWWEVDFGYYFIRALQALGFVRAVRVPDRKLISAKARG